MKAFLYPTPEALAASKQSPPEPDPFLAKLFGSTFNIIPPPPGFFGSGADDLPDDTDLRADEDYADDAEPTIEERKAVADARLTIERAEQKAKRRAEKKAARSRKTWDGTWVSHKGVEHGLDEMPTMYLFYAARMIWNHSVGPEHWFAYFDHELMRFYPDVPKWSTRYRRAAFGDMIEELRLRDFAELPSEAYSQFVAMKALAEFITFK